MVSYRQIWLVPCTDGDGRNGEGAKGISWSVEGERGEAPLLRVLVPLLYGCQGGVAAVPTSHCQDPWVPPAHRDQAVVAPSSEQVSTGPRLVGVQGDDLRAGQELVGGVHATGDHHGVSDQAAAVAMPGLAETGHHLPPLGLCVLGNLVTGIISSYEEHLGGRHLHPTNPCIEAPPWDGGSDLPGLAGGGKEVRGGTGVLSSKDVGSTGQRDGCGLSSLLCEGTVASPHSTRNI